MKTTQELVSYQDGQLTTNSLLVAGKFNKRHSDVLDAIRKLAAENSAVLSMFIVSTYKDERGKDQPLYIMNRDGFSLIVMGFSGKRAMQFKLDFIDAFNKMESELKVAQPKQLTQCEMLLQSVQMMVEQERKVTALESKVEEIEGRTLTRPNFFTVAGYGSLHGFNVNLSMACRIGQKASRLCKDRGIQTDTIPDPRFGTVKMYPKNILQEVFQESL